MSTELPSKDYKLEVLNPSLPGQGLPKTCDSGAIAQRCPQGSADDIKLVSSKTGRSPWKDMMQKFPTRTQKNIRILTVVGITSLFAFLVVLFVSGVSKSIQHKGETIIVQHKYANEYKIRIDSNPEDDYEDLSRFEFGPYSGGNPKDIKILKDMNGKAIPYDQSSSRTPTSRPEETSTSEVLGIWPEPTEENVNTTLDLVQRSVNSDRKKISDKELRLWEPGSEPLRLLLISTWEAGSEMIQDLLQSHPGVYQHFEPLSYLGLKQIRSGKEAFLAQQLIHRLLDCEYDNVEDYMKYVKENVLQTVGKNTEVWKSCKNGPNRLACAEKRFLSESCKMFPIQFVKTSRLRLNLTQLLLNDRKLNVKVIYVVRDPRAVLNSRYSNTRNCRAYSDCSSPEVLCKDMEGDIKVATAFEKFYPDRFLMLKYEDILKNLKSKLRNVFSFLNLELTKLPSNEEIEAKLLKIKSWKDNLIPEELFTIESSCESVIQKFEE